MALTAEQKSTNKEAQKARDRAWRERCRLRREAEGRYTAEIETKYGPAIGSAEEAHNKALAERDVALKAIDAEILALQQKRKDVAAEWFSRLDDLQSPRKEAYGRKNAANDEMGRRLDAEFPDLVGSARWSAAAWGYRNPVKSA